MPQLDKVTFLSQFFWLCVFYLGFYYIVYKHFLPKLSRILTLRKRKMNLSGQGISSLQRETQQVQKDSNSVISKALETSRNVFQRFFLRTNDWLETNVTNVNKTHFQGVNKAFIQSLGESSLSQNILLYHASRNIPEKLAIKILLDKMKNLNSKSFDTVTTKSQQEHQDLVDNRKPKKK
jgi:F-type H+-transporting ATPase subunit b